VVCNARQGVGLVDFGLRFESTHHRFQAAEGDCVIVVFRYATTELRLGRVRHDFRFGLEHRTKIACLSVAWSIGSHRGLRDETWFKDCFLKV
jgi:hypothetical protein